MIGKWILLLAGVVVLAMILVTGYQPEAVAASDSALQELYKAAKAEGKVVWQYQSSLDDVKDLAGAFQAKYPEIKLTVFSFSAARMATRIIGEAAGRKLTLDVGTLRPYLLLPLIERDLLVKYDWTKVGVPQGDISLDGAFINTYENPYVWLRNTNLVSEAEAPKTWEDVLHPKWKGHKISVRNSPSTFFPLFLTWKKDKQKAIDYINRFKQQEAVAGNRTIEVTNRIAQGECPIGRVAMSYVLEAFKEKAPVAVLPIGPAVDFASGVFIPKGGPNPNAAKFLIAWLKGPEAAKEWAKMGFGLAHPPEASDIARVLTKNGIKFERIASREDIDEYQGTFAPMVVKMMGWQPD